MLIKNLLLALPALVSAVAPTAVLATTDLTAQTLAADAHETSLSVVNVFLGAKRPGNYSFVGNIIAAVPTATTYKINCKSGALNLPGFPTTTCNTNDAPWTVTNGPSTMVGLLSTAIGHVTAVLDEHCVLESQTAAYCNYTFIGSSNGKETASTSYTTIITGDSFYEYPVTLTAPSSSTVSQSRPDIAPTQTPTPTTTVTTTKLGVPSTPTSSSGGLKERPLYALLVVNMLFGVLIVC